MIVLTKDQHEILEIIKEFIVKNGYSPSIKELCKLYGCSSAATMPYHLRNLRKLGVIDFQDRKTRTIRPKENINVEERVYISKNKDYQHNYYMNVLKEKRKNNGNI